MTKYGDMPEITGSTVAGRPVRFAKKLMAVWLAILSICTLIDFTAQAQLPPAYRSQFTQVRATVPVGGTNTTILAGPTNTIILVNGASNAFFNVTGLPAGTSTVFTDTNGNALPYTTQSTNLWITLYTTNIPEGIYNFTLNVGGYDTNNLPVTNQFPFVLQSAHIWAGGGFGVTNFGISNNWANAASWLGGVPAATDDVVFADSGAQTNALTYGVGSTPNIGIDTSVTVASIRFAQNTFTNFNPTNALLSSTNSLYHSIRIAPGATLSIIGTNAAGTNGFSLLRDTIGEFGFAPDNTMGVNIYGTNGTLMVSNVNATFSVLLGSGEAPTLNLTNLGTFVCNTKRIALSDYLAYPNYQALNAGYNEGRDQTNYSGFPRRFWSSIFMARTNYFKASYVDPNNYNNEFTRSYALTLLNNEQTGNGSSVNAFFFLGRTNVFNLDSICFMGAGSASGNSGGVRFNAFNEKNATNPGAVFRNYDGVSRMSMFCVADDGGTNQASSSIKATVDFSYGNYSGTGSASGYINLLADRLYVARDRTMIASNQNPNVQGTLTFGSGIVDVNTAYLGCQEHSNKVDWTTLYGAQAYWNYCQGNLVLTNGPYNTSLCRVNGNLILGYTADRNPMGSAQQYNTFGTVTVYSNSTFTASNVICDGGLNFYDVSKGRNNNITINQGGNFVISNSIGYPATGANDFTAADSHGMRLDTLTVQGGKLTIFVNPNTTNVYTRSLSTPGIVPGTLKVAALTGVSAYPAQIPVISYVGSATPFLNADVSALGANFNGYVLNNAPNQTVDIYFTTNTPNNLIWTGAQSPYWNTTDLNWVTAVGGLQTNFNLGDVVTFNDSASVTNVIIDGSMVPSQTGNGVTISNSVNQYTFSSGTIAGTALVYKLGTNSVEFDATEQGPIVVTAGTITGAGGLGATTLYSNVVMNFSGIINGGLTSTGMVTFAGTEYGPVSIQANSLDNFGTINTTINQIITMAQGTAITNEAGAFINVGTGGGAANSFTWDVPYNSVLANFGTIYLYQPRMTVEGLLYGTGTISDPNGGGHESIANGNAPLVRIQSLGVISPGLTPYGSVTNMNLQCRFDYQNDPKNAPYGVATVRIEVDFNNPITNDFMNVDRWNDNTGFLLMTNINPGAGTFTLGQTFGIFNNINSGDPYNYIDTVGFVPTIIPYVPGPGLQWGTTNFGPYGSLSIVQSPLVWDGNGTPVTWDTNGSTANWKSGQVYADNEGAVLDDRATGSTIINLITNVAPESFPTTTVTNTDNLTFTNIVITTNQPAYCPGIVVSNALKNYTIYGVGHIRGMTGLYKTGPGTLTLMNSNDFTGNVIVDNGVLAITNSGSYPNIVSLGIAGSGQMENDVILDGGTLSYIGNTNVSIINQFVINSAGGTITVTSPTNTLLFNTGQKQIVGTGAITKTGPGTLALFNGADDYLGGTIVNAGTLQLNGPAAGTNVIALNNTTTLLITNSLTFTNTLAINGPAVTIQSFGTTIGTNLCYSLWTGSGTVAMNVTNLFVFNNSMTGFSGTISAGSTSGMWMFDGATNRNFCFGSPAATFDLGTGSTVLQTFNGSNLTYSLGALSGGPNTVLSGRTTNSLSLSGTTYSIGAKGVTSTFSGTITNGVETVSIVKVGSGTLYLNGTSTYTGPTTVSNGVLAGTGTIASPLTVTAGGTLSPGATIGKFTVNNTVTLAGTTLMELNRTNTPATNDMLVVSGTLTGGGVLIVTNVGPDLYNGSKFTLFNKAATGFSSVVLPTSNPANTSTYVWNNTLGTDGSITLVSGGSTYVNPNPTNIVTTATNGVLTLTWPADHTGWRLQVQTNPLTIGITTNNSNWYTVPNSTNVNTESFNIDPAQGTIFYRLIYP